MNGHSDRNAHAHLGNIDINASNPSYTCDILIIGAGISGINTAYRLQTSLPDYRYVILEGRDAIGGTWDLFRYPGIRSDSDLHTFGFAWNPWNQDNPIAEGPALRAYMRDTIKKFGIDQQIQFKHQVQSANWSTASNAWTLHVDNEGIAKTYTARFVVFGTGYYNYSEPLATAIPGLETFTGHTIHPQFWPESLDYTGKKIVIIGSGATAITLLPSISQKAAHTTMLQRSPSYILTIPNRSGPPSFLSRLLPTWLYRKLQRICFILFSRTLYGFCQRFPRLARYLLRRSVSAQLPKHIPHDPHFNPTYNPWDQRLCITPDGDFFQCLREGRADVKTDTIRRVTAHGIELDSGEFLAADIIVTATGLKLQIAGGISIAIDGAAKSVHLPSKFLWNGVMLQDIPNACFVIGYAHASWTLGADAAATFLVRLLKHMAARGLVAAVPRMEESEQAGLETRSLLSLSSNYVKRSQGEVPMAANRRPWLPKGDYLGDYWFARWGSLRRGLEVVKGREGEGWRLVEAMKKRV
ncbi:uncharacterized protein PADG_08357 [Paracoccidioides brasiliensis Pb18]|uniref:FAD/NAD(P)-binding domain-containing protein n=2 Tax=Paracoccidioides brasiliensis TaxID=121759 RepID=C1GLW6_PARBD|nr:uncharacterized protein PADG_08357 [Paracoccidioides brasiliensis Pb18]EEH43432.1 hypothetical protein PADG_08357 [Paracoccidioides brasiliensis Pb18]